MTEERGSYRQIMKATSIFGGVQVFSIIINIIRSKFLAIILGPAGIGVLGMLTASLSVISSLTNFGLNTSAVKNVSEAYASNDSLKTSTVVYVLRRLMWITGMLGSAITLIFAPLLSEVTFGSKEYTWSFIYVSISLFLNQISNGQSVLLRSTRHVKATAKSTLLGSILGLITSIPLYYLLGLKGIVPGIIASSFMTLFATFIYSKKLKFSYIQISTTRALIEGKQMLKMGFLISLSGIITLGISYIIRIYINNRGGIADVGLYNAGFAIVNTYVGLIFTAMSSDYYPRLSAISDNNNDCRKLINQQAEISILILSPIIMIFLIFINWVVIFFYSNQFTPINDMILYAAIGMFFKAPSWAVAFLFIAKGDNKLFFVSELITNAYMLVFNIVGYYYWGLTGIGIMFLLTYLIYLAQVYFIAKIKYDFNFSKEFSKLLSFQILIALICLFFVSYSSGLTLYLFGSILIIISTWHAFRELDKRLNISIIEGIKKIFNNHKD